ncbi:MAG: hypothetical protein ABIJ18_00360 [archaeon]
MKRGQGATEYLIILAIVIVIALIVIGVLGTIPGIGGNAKQQASESYWETAEIGVVDYYNTFSTDILTVNVKNNQEDTITIDSVTIDGTVDNTNSSLSPGEEATYTFSKSCENNGDSFEYGVSVVYANSGAGDTMFTFTGTQKLIGTCSA